VRPERVLYGRRAARLAVVVLAMCLAMAGSPSVAAAQAFLPSDLQGTWEIFQLATPPGAFNASSIGAYRGQVTFDEAGVVSGSSVLTENQSGNTYLILIGGNVSISTAGVVTGSLPLSQISGTGPSSGAIALREARLLDNRHTILGAASLFGQLGLFTFAKLEPDQTFGLTDIGGNASGDPAVSADWSYHELTPSNDLSAAAASADGAAWVTGVITFHGLDGCSQGDLVLSDGTIRAQSTDGDGRSGFS
jgi:hypothetical protein